MRFQDSFISSIIGLKRNFVVLCCLLIQFLMGPVEASSWSQLLIYSPWVEGDIDRFDALTLEEKEMIKAASPLLPSNTFMSIIQEEGNYYLQPKCSLNWYVWKDSQWQPIFSSPNIGGFCASLSFIQGEDFYVMGKYGFWEGHVDLVRIPKSNLEMEWVDTNQQPEDFQPLGMFRSKNGILSLFGSRHNLRKDLIGMSDQGYFLNWEDKNWSSFTIDWNHQFLQKRKKIELNRFPGFFSFDTDDYGIIFMENFPFAGAGWYILDKKNLELYFLESHAYLFERPFTVLIGDENDFWLSAPNLGVFTYLKTGDLLAKADRVGKLRINKSGIFTLQREVLIDFIVFIGLLMTGVIWFWRSKVQQKESKILTENEVLPSISPEIENILPDLHVKAGQLLKQQELDVLLGIHEIKNLDLKKVKRARLIRLINEETLRIFGNPCIERVRSEEDRRMMQYRIDPVFTSKKDLVSPD